MRFAILIAGICLLTSCDWRFKGRIPSGQIDYSKKVMGWKPQYSVDTAVKKIRYFNTSRPMENAGKIYVYGNTIFQNDLGKGIHLIDNTDPAKARRIAFIQILGNTDIAIKGNFLYANNFSDLVVVDISDITKPVEVKRFKEAFFTQDSQHPYAWQAPPDTGYYECPHFNIDSTITGWVKDSVYQYCRRY